MAFRHARAGLWRFKRSPERQDRAAMVATFAFIGLFAIGSVDAIVTGGADFTPGSAYAAEYRPTRVMTPAAPRIEAPAVEAAAPDEVLKTAENTNYAFTTEVLLGEPEAELVAVIDEKPIFEDVVFEGYKAEALEPLASAAEDAAVF